MQFVVLSSSRGTTFQAVLDRIADGALRAACLGLVTDREERGCAARARAAGLPVVVVGKITGETRAEHDERLDRAIRSLIADAKKEETIVAALGWMYLLGAWFVSQWRHRIVNVHPSLLPLFPGGHAIEDALAMGGRETGMTIHLIDEGVDTGHVLLQRSCPILPGDTVDTLKERIQALEKEWYPQVLQMIHAGEMHLP